MKTLTAALLLTIIGCAHHGSQTSPAHMSCAQDLFDKSYADSYKKASKFCDEYDDGQIAIAKDLYDNKYVPHFKWGLQSAKGRTVAQLECAKADFPKDPEARRNFSALHEKYDIYSRIIIPDHCK